MTTSTVPTLWFAPPPPSTDTSNGAGDQFMNLFSDPATWQVTSGLSAGFVLTEAFVLQATTAQLTEVINYLNANHLQIAMLAEMIPIQPNGVGLAVEGYGSTASLTAAVQRIASLGGTLNYIAMDAPLEAGVINPAGAQLSITALAQQVAISVAAVQAVFPDVQFMDGEALSATSDLQQWAQAFQQATGTPIAEFDADVNWTSANVQSELASYAAAVEATGATYGLIGNATNVQSTNVSWGVAAESNIAAAYANPLTSPSDVQVETWNLNPTAIGPEGTDGTLAHVAVEVSQFAPLYASGYLTGGEGVTVSTVVPTSSYVGSATDAVAGEAVLVPGVSIDAPSAPAGMTFAVVVTDVAGTLGATASGTGSVSGIGTDVLTLTGDLADINAELASLTYTGSAAGTDTIDVTTYDGVGLVDDHQIAVAIAAPISVTLPSGVGMAALYQNIYGEAPSNATLAAAQAELNAGKTLTQVAAPWIAQAQATISALCEQVQGVSPTALALASLTEALMGGETLAQIRTSLAGAASVQLELAAVYQGQYGSAPTAEQLAALTAQLASGTSLQAAEAPLLAGSQAETEITALYQQVEGQAPDASDLATQARALLTGTPLATIQSELATSALVQGNLAQLYQVIYDNSPTAAQLASLTAELVGGTSYAQVEAQLTAVGEAEVTALFQSVLDRSPTADELAAYMQKLTSGIKLDQITADLALSAESAANVTAAFEQVVGQAPSAAMVSELEQWLTAGPSLTPLTEMNAALESAATTYEQATGQTITADAAALLMSVAPNGGTMFVTVQLDGASTVLLPANFGITVDGGAGNDDFIATAGILRAGQQITGGSGINTLELQGGGLFDLTAPTVLDNIQVVDATEGVSAAMPLILLRAGTDLTLNMESAATNPHSAGTVIHGAANDDTINLGAGSDQVYLGGTGETVNGGSGTDTFFVTSATIGATINGGSGTSYLEVQGGGSAVMGANITHINEVFLTTAGTGYNFTANATQGLEINAGADNDTITVGSASQTVIGSTGNLHVLATAANAGVAIRGGTGSNVLEITTGGAVTLNSADTNVTVELDAATTLLLPTNASVIVDGGAGNDVFLATAGVLRAGQQITGGSGTNTLELQGGGVFDLAAPSVLSNIQVVDATEGLSATMPAIILRAGTDLTLNMEAAATNPQSAETVIHGAANNDTINLGAGVDQVYLGGTGETVDGGSGEDIYIVTSATIGATINGGSGTNIMEVQGGGTAVMGANITHVNEVNLTTAGISFNFTANATQGLEIVAGADNDTITVGNASQTVVGTTGNLLVQATAANAGVAIHSGSGTNELEVTTGGAATLDSVDNNLTVQLTAANTLRLNHMEFIHAVGAGVNDVIIAGAAGQVLSGGGGNDTLEDAGHYGVTFQDTIAGFAGDTLADFSKVDTIDITGMNSASASALYQGTASSGVLDVTNGASSVDIKMSGLTAGGSFHTSSDLHGGTLITYS